MLFRKIKRLYNKKTGHVLPAQGNSEETETTQKVVIFLVPPKEIFNDGVLWVLNICRYSREVLPAAFVALSTLPQQKKFSKYTQVKNHERVYGFDEIIDSLTPKTDLIIHLPECLIHEFYQGLTSRHKEKLKSVAKFRLNFLVWDKESLHGFTDLKLFNFLTTDLSMAMSSPRHCTQAYVNHTQLPTYYLSNYHDCTGIPTFSFQNKEKVILLSSGSDIEMEKLKKCLENIPDFCIKKIDPNRVFEEKLALIAKSFCLISNTYEVLGALAPYVKTPAFQVYSKKSVPGADLIRTPNFFHTIDKMCEELQILLPILVKNELTYNEMVKANKLSMDQFFLYSRFLKNLEMFYQDCPTFMPEIKPPKPKKIKKITRQKNNTFYDVIAKV